MKNKLKIYYLLCFMFIFNIFLSCESEVAINKTKNIDLPKITTIEFNNIDNSFKKLEFKYKLSTYLVNKKDLKKSPKNTIDTLGLTIFTDEIKKITLGNYISYTMRFRRNSNQKAKI